MASFRDQDAERLRFRLASTVTFDLSDDMEDGMEPADLIPSP
jgi:hypothetical protein